MIDLAKFCSQDETRPYLQRPFSAGAYTYATNGHIMVRVARCGDVLEIAGKYEKAKTFDWNKPLGEHDKATFARPALTLPPRSESDEECETCEGDGAAHDCPSCECPCPRCGGSGHTDQERLASTNINRIYDALNYVRLMLSLPDVEIALNSSPEAPLLFRFSGGIGALMPLRYQRQVHVETQGSA